MIMDQGSINILGGKVTGIVGELGEFGGHVGNLCLCVGMGGRREGGRLIFDKSVGCGISVVPVRLHINLRTVGDAV